MFPSRTAEVTQAKYALLRPLPQIQPLRLDSGLEAFRCPLCFPDCAPAGCTPIAGRKALTEHLRWHQNQEQQPEGRFACCYCAKELSSYSSLDRHLLTHTSAFDPPAVSSATSLFIAFVPPLQTSVRSCATSASATSRPTGT